MSYSSVDKICERCRRYQNNECKGLLEYYWTDCLIYLPRKKKKVKYGRIAGKSSQEIPEGAVDK